MKESWFVKFKPYQGNIDKTPVSMNEYLPPAQTIILGLQHTFAMFGATVLAPLLMGFDPSLTILLSGIGTIIFFLITGGRVPSYLGGSFAFIGAVIAVTGYSGSGLNPNIGIALGATIVCGLFYALIGLIVMKTGSQWMENLLPPVVAGAIIMIVGLNLAPGAIRAIAGNSFDTWMALLTAMCIGGIAVFTTGMLRRLLLLVGLIISYLIYFVLANMMGFGKPIDFAPVANAAWFGLPAFHQPEFQLNAILLITPIAFILIAENLAHFKVVSEMTGKNITPHMGKAFFADGICTSMSGAVGGTGLTTYAENIGVMAATRIYSSIVFVVAGLFAIILGLSPKFGAVISTLPVAILTGTSMIVFGLIVIAGAKIWIENKVDFTHNGNIIVVSVTVIMGAGNYSIYIGSLDLGGITTATFAGIILNQIFNRKKKLKKTLDVNVSAEKA
ncbi:solute carrier family 23 protein [Acinetobacter equi]|uniref:Uracil transporter n=1 Tax=Acinetobacter equi TaxID=1324350 RepID=A0A0N9VAC0_9GAMM|nr:solute carrier family 23 protein [Acinetobacter equi]ALH94192.1 uracil transporter [Acinetobacter equi]